MTDLLNVPYSEIFLVTGNCATTNHLHLIVITIVKTTLHLVRLLLLSFSHCSLFSYSR